MAMIRVFRISQKKKMGENGEIVDFYGILWYFEKGLMGSLWGDLGHR